MNKILFIHHGGSVGGAPICMLQLAAALDQERYMPLVVFTHSGPILDYARELGVPARVVPLRSAFFYGTHIPIRARMLVSFLLHFWRTVRMAETLVKQEKPHLVHLNTSVLIPAGLGVVRAGVPLVWHVREVPGPHPRLRRWQTGTICHLADHIIATSEHVRLAFPPDARVAVIHDALSYERFAIDEVTPRTRVRAEFGLGPALPVVGMIGLVQGIKGHYLLVEAAKQAVREVPDVRFLIVAGGVGPQYARSWKGLIKRTLGLPLDNLEHMRRMISEAGLERHFVFTGYRTDIPELLAAMDVLTFLPQAAEGFGRPLIEAMAMGRPVVATDIGPTKEILGQESGMLVPVGDAAAVANALCHLLDDAAARAEMGVAGRSRFLECFEMSRHVAAVETVYAQVLGNAPNLEISDQASMEVATSETA